jgi:AcrR family transcriptional regulator
MATTLSTTGGRGARERIRAAARELFYEQGINATGVERLTERAHVSKRTLYQHFPSKDDVIVDYLDQLSAVIEAAPGASPRERLLAPFDMQMRGIGCGCPFLNAAAEVSDPAHPARLMAQRRKQEFVDSLQAAARDGGVENPERLARRLTLLFNGAAAEGRALDSMQPAIEARALAVELIDAALPR